MAFNARKDGNCHTHKLCFKRITARRIAELLQLAGQKIQGCMACYKCFENKDRQCVFKDDILNAKGRYIILGSTYFTAAPK